MKRFYKLVSTQKMAGGYAITLDGKSVKTPYKSDLLAPNQELANAIVEEWSSQGDKIIPDTMPLTQILSTRIDRVSTERPAMTQSLLKYFDTDLICYYADRPPELVEMQRNIWQPLQKQFEERFAVSLETTDSIKALNQPQEAHESLAKYVEALDDARFTVFQLVVPLAGSIILAVAFVEQEIDAEEIFAAILIEENHKAQIYDEEKYGPDPDEHKKNEAAKTDLVAAARFLELIKN